MSDFFNKHIKKTTARTKEKLLEGLGKAKATQDEAFDFHAANMVKQSKACEKLHKDLKAYSIALKEVSKMEKALRDSIREMYEESWPNREHLCANTQTLDCHTDDLEKAVSDDLLASVGTYVAQFAELKKKVEKRGRKLVDYDCARNNYNSLKESSKKGESDPKVAKAFTELQQAEALYKELNNELLEVLPATFDSRITFVVDNLQQLFNAYSIHQTESSKLNKLLVSQLDQLGQSMDSLRVVRPQPESRSETPITRGDSPMEMPSTPKSERDSSPVISSVTTATENHQSVVSEKVPDSQPVEEVIENKVYPKLTAAQAAAINGDGSVPSAADRELKQKKEKDPNNPFDDTDDEENNVERKFLYDVQSTHEYKAVDTDELSFSAGEKIKVLESFDADQLDEGWLMGEKSDGTRGVFPENFTKKL